MSKKLLKGVLICPDKNTAEEASIENSLEGYYKALDCDTIDIVEREINGTYYDIICDDEALLKGDPLPSALDKLREPMLFGRLFVCHHDDEGELTSLSDEEVKSVLRRCEKGAYLDVRNNRVFPITPLTQVGY